MAQLGQPHILDIKYLESRLGEKKFKDFIKECEDNFKTQVEEILEKAMSMPDLKAVFLSGPTSSGKTTFSGHFTRGLSMRGKKTTLISLDDYYYERALSYDEEGRPDYESASGLELSLLAEHIQAVNEGKEVALPVFDFKQRKRIYPPEKHIKLGKNEVIMVEGLHALSHEVCGSFDSDKILKLFIMPNSRLYSDNRMLNRSDLRKLRRINRDVFHRNTSALATLDFWPIIKKTEDQTIMKYLDTADYYINSALDYEYCILAPLAEKQLNISIEQYMQGELPPSPNVKPGLFYANLNAAIKDAKRLLRNVKSIPYVSAKVVPEDSILKEFV